MDEMEKSKFLNKIININNGIHINFSSCDIDSDNLAQLMKNTSYRRTRVSDIFELISNYYNNLEIGAERPFIKIIDLRFNNIDTKSVLKYCLDNKDSFFSITDENPFYEIDLSYNKGDYFEDEEDYIEYSDILWGLLKKYTNLTINLSYTQYDNIVNKNRYWESRRIILKYAEEQEKWKLETDNNNVKKKFDIETSKKRINELSNKIFGPYYQL